MKLSQKQSNAWHYLNDGETTEILYGGAAGGGKSYLGCMWHIDRRVRYAGSRGFIGRKELKAIKESTLITYLKVARLMGYRSGIDFKFNAQDMVVNWSNGSRTVFKELKQEPSDPNFEGLGSTEFTDAFIDEAGEITEKAFDIINSRIRWMLPEFGLVPKILLSCNPNINWIKHKYIKDKDGNYIGLKPYQKYIRALVDDNPDAKFVEIYKTSLSKMNEYDKARLLYGDWDAIPKTGGEIYKGFDSKRNTGKTTYNPRLPLHISLDENKNPYLPCCIFQIEGKEIRMIDLILGVNPYNTPKGVCNEFKRKYPYHTAGLFIYGDATAKDADIQKSSIKGEEGYDMFDSFEIHLKDYNPERRVNKSNPNVKARVDFMNDVFENNFDGLNFIIDERLHDAIMDFEQTKEASDGRKDKPTVKDAQTGVSYQKWGHITDCSDYIVCYAFSDSFDKNRYGERQIITPYMDDDEFGTLGY